MSLQTLHASGDETPDGPFLPVLHELAVDGYCAFTTALDQVRSMIAMHQQHAADPSLSQAERTWAAQTAVNQQAAIQPLAALIGDRTELDALYALDDLGSDVIPGSWEWTP